MKPIRGPLVAGSLLVAAALLVAACGSDGTGDGPGTSTSGAVSTESDGGGTSPPEGASSSTTAGGAPDTTAPPATGTTSAQDAGPDLASVSVALEPLASLERPIDVVAGPVDGALHVATKGGQVLRLGPGGPEVLLDIGDRVSAGSEQGLLGIELLDGWLYADYTNLDGDSVLTGWRLDAGGVPDPASETTLLVVDQPYANHNGGDLAVDGDGLLWWALGDGGSGGDPHGNGQDVGSLLGKLLRIRPTPDGPAPYEIPDGNPFAAGDGADEVYTFGLRNPWRIDFDPATGDLWVADVGQSAVEEVNHVPAATVAAGVDGGLDFGWNRTEGDRPFEGEAEPGDILPVHTYGHDEGRSISGGVVYRGAAIPGLGGAYLFSDFAGGFLDAVAVGAGGAVEHRRLLEDVGDVVGFGTDGDGEVIVLTLSGDVLRLVPA